MTQTMKATREEAVRALGVNPIVHGGGTPNHYLDVTRPCGHTLRVILYWESFPAGSESESIPAGEWMEAAIESVRDRLPRGDRPLHDVECIYCHR